MKKLYLITKTFPLGAEEKAFLQYEAELLQDKFDMTIVTTQKYVPEENNPGVGNKAVEKRGWKQQVKPMLLEKQRMLCDSCVNVRHGKNLLTS